MVSRLWYVRGTFAGLFLAQHDFVSLSSEPAALNFNNNYVDSSNSKSATSHPTLAASKEDIPPDGGRKLEEVESRFTPIYAPTVRDCCSSAEKRKWSQMNAHKLLQQFASGADSSSSDDEVKELCSKKSTLLPAFSSSPPGKVTILSHHSAFSRGRVRPTEGHARKKHRFAFAEYDEERPSLNFEKMQVSNFNFHSQPSYVPLFPGVGHARACILSCLNIIFAKGRSIQVVWWYASALGLGALELLPGVRFSLLVFVCYTLPIFFFSFHIFVWMVMVCWSISLRGQ